MGIAIVNTKWEKVINNIHFEITTTIDVFKNHAVEVGLRGTAKVRIYEGTGAIDDPSDYEIELANEEICYYYKNATKEVPNPENEWHPITDIKDELSGTHEHRLLWERIEEKIMEDAYASFYEDEDEDEDEDEPD